MSEHVVWQDDGFDVFGEIDSRLKRVNSVQYMKTKTNVEFYRKE